MIANPPKQTLGFFHLFVANSRRVAALFFALQLILLIVWTVLDGYQTKQEFVDAVDFRVQYVCESKYIIVWGVLELIHFLGMLGNNRYYNE